MIVRRFRGWLVRIMSLFNRTALDKELADELASHLQLHIEENQRTGMSPEEARRYALIKLGGLEQTKEIYRSQRGLPFIETLMQDLRYALRTLGKSPNYTAVTVLSLALGIGLNMGIFSVVNAVLLRPLPFKEPERLVVIWEANLRASDEARERNEVAMGNFLDLRNQNEALETVAALSPTHANLTGVGEPQRVQAATVTWDFFQTLGVTPALGSVFTQADETQNGTQQKVVLGHGLWQRRFGSDSGIIGKTISVNNSEHIIIGVTPADFQLDFPTSTQADVWLPMAVDPSKADRKEHYLYVLGRLKKGVTIRQARESANILAGNLQRSYTETNAGWGLNVVPLYQQLVGDTRPHLLALFVAVGIILLIVCANVVNLSLARVTARRKELTIRLSLGASRGRIIRQMLTESLVLSLIGGAVGLLFGIWVSDILSALAPFKLPRLSGPQLHWHVFAFTLGISVLSGLIFGLVPAIQASKTDLNRGLKDGSKTMTPGGVPQSPARRAGYLRSGPDAYASYRCRSDG